MRRRFLLIHNPLAGLRGCRLTRRVVDELKRRGAHLTELKEATVVAMAARMAQHFDDAAFDAVVVAGGDGTVRALARHIHDHTLPVGLVPAGTGNVLAHEIGIPLDAEEIAQSLMSAPEVFIENSCVNDEPFLLMAGVGFDGDVIAQLDVALKQQIGKLAYVIPFIRALWRRPRLFDVDVDGTTHKASWVVVTRARHYAGRFILATNADLRSSGMTAVLFEATTRRGRLRELAALAAGQLATLDSVRLISCKNVTVDPTPAVRLQADGDPLGLTPVEITTGHARFRLIVPRAYARTAENMEAGVS